jgi:hypothetical protein
MTVTIKQVELFEKVVAQIASLQAEMAVLSKSKPDGPVNKFKLRHINEKLAEANELLTGMHKPLKEFSQFEDADLPTNSDVVLILSQYLEGLEGWRSSQMKRIDYSYYWDIKSGEKIESQSPTRFKKER